MGTEDNAFPSRRPSVRQASRDHRHQTGRRGSDYTVSIDHVPQKLLAKLSVVDGHWIWTGQLNNKGYGLKHAAYVSAADRKAQKRPVHALVWEALIGVVPDDMELDHLCEFKACANPQCLEEVTPAENLRRLSERQATCRREGHPRTPENIYTDPKGRTRCRPCAREAGRAPARLARNAERRRRKNAERRAAA